MEKSLKTYEVQSKQKTLAATICFLISFTPILIFIKSISGFFVGEWFNLDTFMMYLIMLSMFAKSFLIVGRSLKLDVIFMILFFSFVYMATYLFFPANRELMFTSVSDLLGNPLYVLFFFSISGYVLIRYITDYNLLYDYLTVSSVTVGICSISTYFIQLFRGMNLEYMTFSYNMTLHTSFLLAMYFERKKPLFLVIGLLCFTAIILTGARGPLVCIAFSLLLYLFLRKAPLLNKMRVFMLLATSLLFIALFFDSILSWLIFISDKFGMNSRTLQLLMNNSIFNDSGRGMIWTAIIKSFSLFGAGLYGDKLISDGHYAHNFFIEVMAQFGYVFGPIIICTVLLVIFSGIKSRNKKIRNLVTIFLSTGFIKLFLSGSYLNMEPAFYILLGLGVNSIHHSKEDESENIVVVQHNATDCFKQFKQTGR